MTSGKLHIQSFGLLWLLTSVYIVRVTSSTLATVKGSSAASYALIAQRSRVEGGLLTIPLDDKARLVHRSVKDVAQYTIRLQYGPRGKRLAMRATNSVEYKSWVSAIETALLTLSAFNGPAMALPIASSKSAGRTAAGQAHRRVSQKTPNLNSELTTPSPSLHLIKLLAEGYDSITRQWMLAATETRQFSTEIASIQPSRINPELCVAS